MVDCETVLNDDQITHHLLVAVEHVDLSISVHIDDDAIALLWQAIFWV